jgi:hypothetical protein
VSAVIFAGVAMKARLPGGRITIDRTLLRRSRRAAGPEPR